MFVLLSNATGDVNGPFTLLQPLQVPFFLSFPLPPSLFFSLTRGGHICLVSTPPIPPAIPLTFQDNSPPYFWLLVFVCLLLLLFLFWGDVRACSCAAVVSVK